MEYGIGKTTSTFPYPVYSVKCVVHMFNENLWLIGPNLPTNGRFFNTVEHKNLS